MKKTPKFFITGLTLLAFSTLNSQLSTAFAQGSLTPPGPPAPTMKSLDQIEPRTIVNAANTPGDSGNLFVISQPGSYYLTTNLNYANVVGNFTSSTLTPNYSAPSGKNGIEIAANNVTLDLNGFAVLGGPGSYSGIDIQGAQTNITVRNGTISGWERSGSHSESSVSVNMVFERLNVSANNDGIFLNGVGVVRDCNCLNNWDCGILCYGGGIVSGCTADYNADYGINVSYSTVSGCSAQHNYMTGIVVTYGTVSGCSAQNNYADGIDVYSGTVSGCSASYNNRSGILVEVANSVIIGNNCTGNNYANNSYDAGIIIDDINNRVEDNRVTASGHAGIQIWNNSYITNNVIIKNSVSGNGPNNYILPNAQIVGPIITATGTITNSNPWANFSF